MNYYVLSALMYSGIYLDKTEFEKAKLQNTVYSEETFTNYKEAEAFLIKEYNGKIKKYYAIQNGKYKGVVVNWSDCEKLISGYKDAKYKSFPDISSAIVFVIGEPLPELFEARCEPIAKSTEKPYAYVDGSFNSDTKTYGYGAILFANGTSHKFSGSGNDAELASMRNVAGEINGSKRVIEEAIKLKLPEVTIFYDYEGIEKWATGEWNCYKTGTKSYKEFIDSVRGVIKIKFVKVKAHSGVELNEAVDKLAKKAVGLL